MSEIDLLKLFRNDVPEPSTDAWLRARAAIEATRTELDPGEHPTPIDAAIATTRGADAAAQRIRKLGRPRRRKALACLACLACAVATVGALAGTGVFSGPAVLNSRTVAFRTTSAIGSASSTEISYTHTVETNVTGAVTASYDSWSFGVAGRVEDLGADGSPTIDRSWTKTGGSDAGVLVDYASQTWQSTNGQPQLSQGAHGNVETGLALGNVIRRQLADGHAGVVEPTTLNGQPALELSRTIDTFPRNTGRAGGSDPAGNSGVVPAGNGAAAGDSGAGALPTGHFSLALWVDPTTYLPRQMLETMPSGLTIESSIEWLAASSTNLTQLVAPTPSGFAELPTPVTSPATSGDSNE